MHYKKILREILDSQNYLCLATADKHSKPWASPVAYVCDEDFSIYFISYIESLHAQNIRNNNEVAFSIYDSDQLLRNALGIQASGFAEIIDEHSMSAILRQSLFDKVALAVLAKEYAIYRITLTDIFLPDAERWKEFHDLRIKIEI
jgi:uncharacterized protein YhbP (UPF0306 family)